MRVDRNRFGWGLFLVVLGLVPLAVSTGLVDEGGLRQAGQLWPLILVGIGVGMLLGRERMALVGTLVVSITLGLAGGVLIAGAGGTVLAGGACAPGGGTGQTGGTLISGTAVTVEGGCGDLHVTAQPGAAWQASGDAAEGLRVVTGAQSITIRPGGDHLFNGSQTLTLALPTDPQLDLHLKAGLGDLSVALPGAHLTGFQADVSFGTGAIDLTGATLSGTLDGSFSFGSGTVVLPGGTYGGTISSSFGSLHVCVPPDVAVHVTARAGLGSVSVEDGFDQVADGWQTSDYATATQRADLHLSTSFGSLSITRGTCG